MQNWVYNLLSFCLKIIFIFLVSGNCLAYAPFANKDTSKIKSPEFQITASEKDPWFGKDKFDHFLTSAFLISFFYHAGRSQMSWSGTQTANISAGITLGIGLGKELWDKKSKRGHPSWRDIAADFLGAGLGYLICVQRIKGH